MCLLSTLSSFQTIKPANAGFFVYAILVLMRENQVKNRIKYLPCAATTISADQLDKALKGMTFDFYKTIVFYLAIIGLLILALYTLNKKVKKKAFRYLGFAFLTLFLGFALILGIFSVNLNNPYHYDYSNLTFDCFDPILGYLE
jgi:hypothetical protein